MKNLVFATGNQHKIREVGQLIGNRFQLQSLADIGCPEDLPETSPTIPENALQKARYVYEHFGVNCFAEDTGLEVHALGGEPGVFSARYAGEGRNATENMRLLLEKLAANPDRSAQFRTVVALIWSGEEFLFEGIAEGTIRHEPSGSGGFGYDPVFEPLGYGVTFAEMEADEKNAISHRGKAIGKLAAFLRNLQEGATAKQG